MSVLRRLGFDEAEVSLEPTSSGKIGGVIKSDKFRGKSQVARQDDLWQGLRTHLSEADAVRIVALLTVTPDEVGDDD